MIINMQSGGVVPERILDAQTITPSTENQVIETGSYLRGALTVLGDPDLIPENIPHDVILFGKQGTRPDNVGAYVWSKYIGNPNIKTVLSFTSVVSATSKQVVIQTTSSNSDFLELTPEYFAGMYVQGTLRGTYGNWTVKITINADGTATSKEDDTYSGSTTYHNGTVTYDKTTGRLTIDLDGTISYSALTSGNITTLSKNVTVSEKITLIAYVVAPTSSAYPDGAVHTDGYYYKRLDIPAIQQASYNQALLDISEVTE